MITNSSLMSFSNTTSLERMGTGPHKAEDVLKVMEALGSAVMKERVKDKVGPFGFNKKAKEKD